MNVTVLNSRVMPLFLKLQRLIEDLQQPTPLVTHQAGSLIKRQQIPYWAERGWVRSGTNYRGTYQTPYGSYLGSIEDHGLGRIRFFIQDPPPTLATSGHWQCFRLRPDGTYEIHMALPPRDVSSGIMAIEKLVTEAFHRS
jgi:hypothetical protein